MYRVTKVLNHNAVLAVEQGNNAQCLLLGKGIGFGKKISETIDSAMGASVYYLQEYKDRGGADTIIKSIDPEILEIANQVLDQAESVFGTIDRSILFPLADHIYYAVERIKKKEQISNPLTEDIRLLFHMEYKVAACIIPILQLVRMKWDILHCMCIQLSTMKTCQMRYRLHVQCVPASKLWKKPWIKKLTFCHCPIID